MVKRTILILMILTLSVLIVATAFADTSAAINSINNSKKYVGVYVNSTTDMEPFGDCANIMAWFASFEDYYEGRLMVCLDERKYTAFVTLQPRGMDIKELAAGAYDEQIIEYLSHFSEGNRVHNEVFVRFAHEFEMRPKYKKAWYKWQSKDSNAYIAAWRHMVDLGRQYAPNIKWVWSPNRADKYTTPYYPGDEYVDYISISMNNYKNQYKTFEAFYKEVGQRDYLEKYNKPIIFGETGEDCNKHDQKKAYIESIVDYVNNYDRAIGFVILNDDVINGDGKPRNFNFSEEEDILQSFTEKSREMIHK